MPEKIRHLFTEVDIYVMFDFMEERYHMSREWRKKFKDDLMRTPKNLPAQEFFFRFLYANLNHALQTILFRAQGDIVNDIACYLMKDRIAEKEKEALQQHNFYRKGGWKKEETKL